MARRNWTLDEIARLRTLATDSRHSTYDLAQMFERNPETIRRAMVKHGISRLSRGRALELNYFWRDGKKIDKQGYVLVKCHGHPFLNSQGYIREHRLVMEMVLGRYLLPGEVVHHKDRNPQNNTPDNLVVFESNGSHLKAELKGKGPDWTQEGRARILAAIRQPRGPNPRLRDTALNRPPRPRNSLGQFLPEGDDAP